MSEQQPIIFPSARETDIADEISERALDHVPHPYFESLLNLADAQRALALQDFTLTSRQLMREFTVCHDLALAQLVRAHKGSAATQKLLLSGGLEKMLNLDTAKNTSLDEIFQAYVMGPMPARGGHHGGMMEPAVNTLRNRMVNLSGSERAGVGLGAVAGIYYVSKATLPHVAQVARNAAAPDPVVRGPITPYGVLLNEALRDLSQATSGRRAVAFGATQAFQLSDDLFSFLKSRLNRVS